MFKDWLLTAQAVMDKVKADKLREVTDGHDGTWIAHPGLMKIAKQVFSSCCVSHVSQTQLIFWCAGCRVSV